MGAAGPEEQNKVAEVCRQQRHQTLGGWGRIHLDSRSTELGVSPESRNPGDNDNDGHDRSSLPGGGGLG